MPDENEGRSSEFGAKISRLAGGMMKLDAGALARLRRMDIEGPGELEFWKVVVDADIQKDRAGMSLVKIMALLAPKGEIVHRVPFHNFGNPLGKALAVAEVSETRLARFLALPFARRGDAMEGFARRLVASGATANGVDCTDIARLLFFDAAWPLRRVAETYYRQFDRPSSDAKKDDAA